MLKYIAVIAAALAIGVPAANAGQQRNFVCAYNMPGSYIVVVHGRNNNINYCRVVTGAGGTRTYNYARPTFCTWKLRDSDVRISIRARNRYIGYYACELWADMATNDWVQVR